MINNKKSFILYDDQKELVSQLSDEQAGKLLKAVYNYTSTGGVSNLDPLTNIVFIAIRQNLDRNAEKYNATVEKRKLAGSKGGKQKAANLANAVFANQNAANLADNDNVNDNGNVNDNVLSLNAENVDDEERKILINYVRKNKLATKNINAYVSKIIQNGDHRAIIENEKKRLKVKGPPDKEDLLKIISGIKDKKSAYFAIVKYFDQGKAYPPAEFNDVMKKYEFESFEQIEEYSKILYKEQYGY